MHPLPPQPPHTRRGVSRGDAPYIKVIPLAHRLLLSLPRKVGQRFGVLRAGALNSGAAFPYATRLRLLPALIAPQQQLLLLGGCPKSPCALLGGAGQPSLRDVGPSSTSAGLKLLG